MSIDVGKAKLAKRKILAGLAKSYGGYVSAGGFGGALYPTLDLECKFKTNSPDGQIRAMLYQMGDGGNNYVAKLTLEEFKVWHKENVS